jgi:hypothetical protein
MKLRPIEAYVEINKKREKHIFIRDIDDDDSVWMKVTIYSDRDSEFIQDIDYWNIGELGDFGKALVEVRSCLS